MNSQSVSTRMIKALLMGAVLMALLLGFKVSVSAAETLYPSTSKVTVLTKGFTYQLGDVTGGYIYKSSAPAVASVNNTGVIVAKKVGGTYIGCYSGTTGQLLYSYPVLVKKNKYYNRSYASVGVRNFSYGTWLVPLKGAIKGKYLVLKMAVVNNRLLNITGVRFNLYASIGGTRIFAKRIRLGKRVNRYSKTKATIKIKLNKRQRQALDLNRVSFY